MANRQQLLVGWRFFGCRRVAVQGFGEAKRSVANVKSLASELVCIWFSPNGTRNSKCPNVATPEGETKIHHLFFVPVPAFSIPPSSGPPCPFLLQVPWGYWKRFARAGGRSSPRRRGWGFWKGLG